MIIIIICQTYLVSGGWSGDPPAQKISSTELMVETADAWVYTGSLPYPNTGFCGANIDNRVLMTGN